MIELRFYPGTAKVDRGNGERNLSNREKAGGILKWAHRK